MLFSIPQEQGERKAVERRECCIQRRFIHKSVGLAYGLNVENKRTPSSLGQAFGVIFKVMVNAKEQLFGRRVEEDQ